MSESKRSISRNFYQFPPVISTDRLRLFFKYHYNLDRSRNVKVLFQIYTVLSTSPYQSVDIRDELLLLGEMTTESLKSAIRNCSSEVSGEVFSYYLQN